MRLLVSKRVLGVSSTFCLWVTKKHCHIWPSPSVCEEFQMKSLQGSPRLKLSMFSFMLLRFSSTSETGMVRMLPSPQIQQGWFKSQPWFWLQEALESMRDHKRSSCVLVSYKHLTLVHSCCVYMLFLSSLLSTLLKHIPAYLPGGSWFFWSGSRWELVLPGRDVLTELVCLGEGRDSWPM